MDQPTTQPSKIPSSGDRDFSITEAIKFGWGSTLKILGLFIALVLTSILAFTISVFILSIFFKSFPALLGYKSLISFFVSLFLYIFSFIIQLGYIRIGFRLIDRQEVGISDFFKEYTKIPKFILATVIYVLAGAFGLVLLIIPGIVILIRFGFYSFLLVDKNLNPIDSLKQSWNITKGFTIELFILAITGIIIEVLGVLAFGIGIFLAAPTVLFAYVYVYRKLLSQTPGI